MPSLTILGVNAITSPSRQVHKIVKGGNHAGHRPQNSAFGGACQFSYCPDFSLKRGGPRGSDNAKAGSSREARSQKSALIGRATFNNVGVLNVEIAPTLGPIIVKGGNHAVLRSQKSAMSPERLADPACYHPGRRVL